MSAKLARCARCAIVAFLATQLRLARSSEARLRARQARCDSAVLGALALRRARRLAVAVACEAALAQAVLAN